MDELSRFKQDNQELVEWIRSVAGELREARVLNDKGWSTVTHLGTSVLKVTAAGSFPDGARMFEWVGGTSPGRVPELIAWRVGLDGRREMLFRPFGGIPVDQLPLDQRADGLVSMASCFGKIQCDLRGSSSTDLPAVPARMIPALLDELLDGAVSICKSDHADRWSVECAKHSVPEELSSVIRPWRGAVADWAAELEEGGWSSGVDHVDFLPHNGNLLSNRQCIVYDWEQATRGVSFFSLDILLAYAQSIDEGHDGLVLTAERPTPTQQHIREAFLAEFPGPLDLALRLAPIRYCWAEWKQAQSTDMTRYGVDDVAWWLCRALRRWEAS